MVALAALLAILAFGSATVVALIQRHHAVALIAFGLGLAVLASGWLPLPVR